MRNQARTVEGELSQRIDAFQEGIKSGSQELAIRHLFRAGVYWASYDTQLSRDPSIPQILESLSVHISREYPQLNNYVQSTRTVIHEQGVIDEPSVMLRSILRNRGPNTPQLLLANVKKEILACQKALSRAEDVKKKLAVWKEGIGVRNNPEAVCIVDMHGEDQVQ
jgi:hypothetical protein